MCSKINSFISPLVVLYFILCFNPVISADPLILSPLIERGDFARAQQEAVVSPLLPGVESFAGYITVNKTYDSNMFFWMFKAFEGDWKTKPLIVWLQGGPGGSSLYGMFKEIGPFYMDAQGKLIKRKYPWCQKYNLLFIDNPIGAGFSFTRQDAGYASSLAVVASDFYKFIVQFYQMFPSLGNNPLFIMGQSYAGKYIPAFAHYIYLRNKENKGKGFVVPLTATSIGNGLTDPYNMMHYGDYLYQLGMIDSNERDFLYKLEDTARKLIKKGDYYKAEQVWNYKIFPAIFQFAKIRGTFNYINDSLSLGVMEEAFLNKPETQRALHVNNQPFTFLNKKAYNHLVLDIMQSVKPLIEDLLNWEAFDFVAYSGQLDILCAYPLSVNVYQKLKWKHSDSYKKVKRCFFHVDEEIVGYFKTAGVFTEIMFRGCGHHVPTDCPKIASRFLDVFVGNRAIFKCMEVGESSTSSG